MRLVAVGDLQLGDSPTTVGYGFYSRYRGTSLVSLFSAIQPALDDGDILFGNLETVLDPPPAGERSRATLQLRGEPRFAEDLARVGFRVLNVANNHAAQFGDKAFHDSVAAVRAAGIAPIGVRGAAPWATEPAVITANGQKIGVLGYCLRPRQYGPSTPPYAEGSLEAISDDVRRLRPTVDSVVVSLHWGEEFVPKPSEEETRVGRAIIDAGAALILGHHPHVVRPVERYKAGVIVYSLGNLMGDMTWHAPFRRGMIFQCSVNGDSVTAAATIDTYLEDDYRPVVRAEAKMVEVGPELVQGLPAGEYSRQIDETISRARVDSYKSTIMNLPRIPFGILFQLVADTVRNKVGAIAARGAR